MRQHSSYFLHVVGSSVSCRGAYLTIAHALLHFTLFCMVQSRYKSCVYPYGTGWCVLAQNTWHPPMCILYRHNSPLSRLDFFFGGSCEDIVRLNINSEKPKFYSSHISIFYTGGPLRNPKSPSSLLHFDPLCFCLFWWKVSRYFKALGCFWQSKNAISLLYTIPNCT